MVRTYVKRKVVSYSESDLTTALRKLREKEYKSIRQASNKTGIPFTTLCKHASKPLLKIGAGRQIVIPMNIENDIATCLKYLCNCGFGLSRADIIAKVNGGSSTFSCSRSIAS